MTKLENFLDRCSQAYYAGTPVISDAQFDALAESINYNKVGAQLEAENQEQHLYPMWSLQKYYADEKRETPLATETDVSVSIKLDGAAISLLYVDGVLIRAMTRGNGVRGQIITDKLLACQHLVPHTIKLHGIYQITGEIVAPSHVENSRNYAAGALNLKDVAEFKTRALSFFAYGVYPYLRETYDQDMQRLKSLGFSTIKERDLDKLYPSDGVVFRVNNNAVFDSYGYTTKHPKGAYARKERSELVETTLLAVEWQVGKTGKVTPVGILEPVYIGDALVSRATLNNPGFIQQLGLEIGDQVAVARAGAIIPQIVCKVDP